MLDDEKPSGRHVSTHVYSLQDTLGDNLPTAVYPVAPSGDNLPTAVYPVAPSGDNLPTAVYPVAPTRIYPSTSSASSARTNICSTEPKRRTIREKFSSWLHEIIASDLSVFLFFIPIILVPYLIDHL